MVYGRTHTGSCRPLSLITVSDHYIPPRLCYTTLHCVTLYYIVLHHIELHYILPWPLYITLCETFIDHSSPHYRLHVWSEHRVPAKSPVCSKIYAQAYMSRSRMHASHILHLASEVPQRSFNRGSVNVCNVCVMLKVQLIK